HYQAGAGRSSHSAAADGFHGNGSPAARRGNSAGSHLISMSPQRQTGGAKGAGATTSKILGIPLGSALQVAISSGQILVTKGNPSISKVMGGKHAIVSGAAGSIVGQQVIVKATGAAGGTGKSG
ncbi:unnamed protein product, partial [Coregonus sp. 'balchen']